MLKLAGALTQSLLAQPESGMGYQIVEAMTVSKQPRRGIAYNAELLLFEDEPRRVLLSASYERLLESAQASTGEITSLRVIQRPPTPSALAGVRESSTAYGKHTGPAKDAPYEKTKTGDVFKRFSAYRNDRRVQADGSLSPGSYATTEADAKNVKTGAEAVARYALPNPEPASYKFTIRPNKDTVIQYGIAQPAYGQPGGGVEVLFEKGTQPQTVTGPEKIPDK